MVENQYTEAQELIQKLKARPEARPEADRLSLFNAKMATASVTVLNGVSANSVLLRASEQKELNSKLLCAFKIRRNCLYGFRY